MKSWQYEIGEVLLIHRKGQQVPARIVGFTDQLDDNMPLLCHVRVCGNSRWGGRRIKIYQCDIIQSFPEWEAERKAKWEVALSAHVDEMWAKMTDAEKRQVHEDAVKLGFGREQRSPLDIMIDRACGR